MRKKKSKIHMNLHREQITDDHVEMRRVLTRDVSVAQMTDPLSGGSAPIDGVM